MTREPERPTEVYIGPLRYTIEWPDEVTSTSGDTMYGESNHHHGTIRVAASMTPEVQRLTLLHECMHCAWNAGGGRVIEISRGLRKDHDAEELAISLLESGTMSLFSDPRNAPVRAWLSS